MAGKVRVEAMPSYVMAMMHRASSISIGAGEVIVMAFLPCLCLIRTMVMMVIVIVRR